ncbi:MAG: glutathione S-transferase N-terminal domain-containing protein [Gammaproteobacteria bacterium]|nr:glutathione S-transferase N-terminal domain-containing protein [Gammaproteobacteria bacterium]
MALVANRRSVMTLFSSPTCPESHRVRVVLAEKGITVEILDVVAGNKFEDLIDLNPYNTVPTLVDRELVLYDPRAIMEYLDERFPHPPLMPVDPVSRARTRLALYRIEKDWYELVTALESKGEKTSSKARKILRDSLTSSAEVFNAKPYFLSDEFTLVDATIVPILWRLKRYRIDLPRQAKPVLQYAERMFARESFQASLSEAEQEMME